MHTPEYLNHEEYQLRLKKLEEIKALGVNPYPYSYKNCDHAQALLQYAEGKEIGHSEDAFSGKTQPCTVSGRLVLFRAMGKNAFGHIQDKTGRIQIMFNRDITEVEGFHPNEELSNMKFIEKKIDLGDIIGVEGYLFRTQKGETTVFAKKVTLLCKSLLPLPDKHSGLVDKGVRYRKRWLDLIANHEAKDKLVMRSHIIKEIRSFMDKEGFLEVETPVLQNNYGGAEAKPFITTLNALDQKMFLRISLEIELKKLMVGGLERVYEIGKVFRNEGIDRTHNPEFTEIEAYCANWDYNNTMDFIERLFEHVALKLFNTTQIEHTKENGEKIIIDLKRGWQKLTMKESIKKYAHISCDDLSDNQMREILLKSGKVEKKEVDESNRGLLIALLFSTFVEEHLIEPHHIIDHPIETTPLCKPLREPDKDQLVERFESFMLGHEFLNSYSELNNPILQRELLVEQQKRLQKDKTSPPLDEEFIEAITQGMPPCSGWGMGVDRFVMLFTNAHSIRDVIYFPLMKPED